MKILSFIALSAILFANVAFGQTGEKALPQKVYSIVKEYRDFDWYAEQAAQWKSELAKDSADADAWLNYYTANRMALLVDSERFSKNPGGVFAPLNAIVDAVWSAAPETYEAYYIKAWNAGAIDKNQFDLLQKAYEIDPSRPEVYDDLAGYYETRRNMKKLSEICKKWVESGDLSPGLLNYNYNVLMTLNRNAILLTNGDNDTYPAWVLQRGMGIRPDVAALNLSLLGVEDYRNKVFKELGVSPFKPDMAKINNTKNPKAFLLKAIIDHIIANRTKKQPLYFAATMYATFREVYDEKLHLVGLAFRYSEEEIDDKAALRMCFERTYLLDYLTESFTRDVSRILVLKMNANYLPMFVKLLEHYALCGDTRRKEEVIAYLKKIGEDTGNEEYIENLIKQVQ